MNKTHPNRTGTKNPNSKLTWTKVKLIRQNKRASYQELADKYGVSIATISQVKRELTWPESKRPAKRSYVVSRSKGHELAGQFAVTIPRRKAKMGAAS